jgi:hypothetical protein
MNHAETDAANRGSRGGNRGSVQLGWMHMQMVKSAPFSLSPSGHHDVIAKHCSGTRRSPKWIVCSGGQPV